MHDEVAVVPAHVRAILADMTFLPALRNGAAVAATVTVNLADFYR